MIGDLGCNIAVLAGADGLLVVDSGLPAEAPRLEQILTDAFGKPVRYLLNTHFNFDHVGGNERLARAGAAIVAHERSRQRMTEPWCVEEFLGIRYPALPPFPEWALPVFSFNDRMTVHLGSETVDLVHIAGGHTDGDAIIVFREANVIHAGDLYFSHSFPIFEGKVEGCIAAVGQILRHCDDMTRIIPGHGQVSSRADLVAYREMLVTARDRIDALVEAGKTVEEIAAMDPISELCPGGMSWLPPKIFIYCVARGLSIGSSHCPAAEEP